MVNSALIAGGDPGLTIDPEVSLAIAYAPARLRPGLRALWAFDTRLANIVRSTREPMLGQMKLTWWHDAVAQVPPPGGEPILAALAEAQVDRAVLQRMVTGWEALLEDNEAGPLSEYATGRGGGLFAAAGALLGLIQPLGGAGPGWALVDLARHHSNAATRDLALSLARQQLAIAPIRWSRPARPLGILVKLARRDLTGLQRQGAPARLLAMAALALTGR